MARQKNEARFRAYLALGIVGAGLVGIIIVSVTAIVAADGIDRKDMTRLVYAGTIPVLSTWVGTVLAFYFTRENMSAAAESTARLLGGLTSTPVMDVMIPAARMTAHDLPAGGDVKDVQLGELYSVMAAAGVARVPILNDSKAVLYVVHKTTIDSFARNLKPPKDPMTLTETMLELLNSPQHKKMLEAIGFVPPTAVIADARREMSSIAGCHDVFVTTNGKESNPVIRWLTNTDLAAAN